MKNSRSFAAGNHVTFFVLQLWNANTRDGKSKSKNLLSLLIFRFAINSSIFTGWFNELWKNTMNGLYQWKK